MRPNWSVFDLAWLVMQMTSSMERAGSPGERIDWYLGVLADRLDRVRLALEACRNA